MPKKNSSNTIKKPQLTEAKILVTAMRLADSKGLDALTMRALAKALSVEAMSIYYHVKNKDALLALMVDKIFGKIYTPQLTLDWRAEMEARAKSLREVLHKHAWAMPIIESMRDPGIRNLQHHEAVLACLRNAGFSLRLTAHAYALMDAYIYGFVAQELALPFSTYEDVKDIAEHIISSMDPTDFPRFYELTVNHVLQPGYNFPQEFAFGLNIVLNGLETHLKEEQSHQNAKG